MMILLEGDFWNVSWIWSFKISWYPLLSPCWVHNSCFLLSDVLETCSFSPGKNYIYNPKMISFRNMLGLTCFLYIHVVDSPECRPPSSSKRRSCFRGRHRKAQRVTIRRPTQPFVQLDRRGSTRKPFFGWLDLLLSDLDLLVENDSIWWGFFSVGWNQHQKSSWSVWVFHPIMGLR